MGFQGSHAIHLRRIGLFLDGASRASLLPFLPLLLFALKQHKHEGELVKIDLPSSLWSSVVWSTAGLVACYNLGRFIGRMLSNTQRIQRWHADAGSKAFSRTVGAVIALQLFCFGSGMHTSAPLLGYRFLMGICVGMIYERGTCKASSQEESESMRSKIVSTSDGYECGSGGMERDTFHFSVESGLAKIWLAGFGLSMLANGLVYHPIRQSYIFSVLTGGSSWSFLPAMVFFGGVVYAVSMVVECCFMHLSTSDPIEFENKKNDDFWKKPIESDVGARVRLGSNGNVRLDYMEGGRGGARDRFDSNFSNDTFYDCESYNGNLSIDYMYSDMMDEKSDTTPIRSTCSSKDHSNSIAKYVGNKCLFEDGSPAMVPPGLCPSVTPRSYHEMHRSYADKKYMESKKWRMERKVWKIHTIPHVDFDRVKEAYPHYMHGYTHQGYPVIYEKPGGTKLKEIFQSDFSIENMLHHYVFLMEYIANVACHKPEMRERLDQRSHADSASRHGFCVVMDISQMSVTFISGKVLSYLSQAGVLNKAHYPKSLVRCFLVNAPFWAAGAFSTIRSALPENVEVEIFSASNQLDGLRKYIDDDQIPPEYGGSSTHTLAEHPLELGIYNLVKDNIDNIVDDDENIELEEGSDDYLNRCESDETSVIETTSPTKVSFRENKNLLFEDVDLERGASNLSPIKSDHNAVTLRIQSSDGFDKEEYTFILVSVMHGIWSAVQGSLETILPIWLLAPTTMGGLSYEPARSGVTLFTASIVLLCALRTNVARYISRIPVDSPMQGYRIGVGSEACLMALLPFIPYITNYDKMGVMISNVLLGAMLFIASMLGRGSSAILHTLAAQAYVDKLCLRCDRRTKLGQLLNRIVLFFQRGGFTTLLGVAGEICGSIFIAPILVFSMDENHPYPFNGVLSFYISGQVCVFLYMVSFFLRVTGDEIYQKVESENSKGHYRPTRRCSIVRKAAAVSIGDVTSLVEESMKPAKSENFNSKRI